MMGRSNPRRSTVVFSCDGLNNPEVANFSSEGEEEIVFIIHLDTPYKYTTITWLGFDLLSYDLLRSYIPHLTVSMLSSSGIPGARAESGVVGHAIAELMS